MAEADTVSQRALNEGYEPEDVRVGGILIVAAASLVVLVLIGGALWGMVELFTAEWRQPAPTPVELTRIETPPPRLQTAPDTDLAALRAREENTLRHFAWADRSAGIVQIPIDAAMDLLVGRGWPQPDRPAETVPPRAEVSPGAPPTGSEMPAPGPSEPAKPSETLAPFAPRPVPRAGSQEVGPSEAAPHGGQR